MLVKLRSLSWSIFRSSDRFLAEDADVFRDTTLCERLGLLDPVLAFDAAVETQISVDPVTFGFLPRRNLREGVDAEFVQDLLILRADAGDKLEIVHHGRPFDPLGAVLVIEGGPGRSEEP